MAHHRRNRPKSSRAGCLLCKPHKSQRTKDTLGAQTMQERRAIATDSEIVTDEPADEWDYDSGIYEWPAFEAVQSFAPADDSELATLVEERRERLSVPVFDVLNHV